MQYLNGEWIRAVLNLNVPPGALGSHPSIADKLVAPSMEAMRDRQFAALGTLACAYCSEEAAAFAGEDGKLLRDRLVDMRKLLLSSAYRFDVKLDDVIDRDYAAELRAVGVGQLGIKAPGEPARAPEGAPLFPDNPDPPPETEPAGGPPFAAIEARYAGAGIDPLVIGGLAAGGLAALFLALRMARNRRRSRV